MEEGAVVGNSGNDEYGDPEVLNSVGLGHLLVLFWTKSDSKVDDKGRVYYEFTINPNEYHIIGCDDDHRRKLLLYRSHFLDATNCKGVIHRVYSNNRPEMSPNISFYSEDEYPHLQVALSCGILSSFCFPFKGYSVMEIVSTCNQDVQGLITFWKSTKGFYPRWHRDIKEYQKFGVQPVPEIDHMLEVVSQTFHLPLTQYWMYVVSESLRLMVQKFSYEVPEINWCQFKDAYLHMQSGGNMGPLRRSSYETGAFFCRDITALSITQYPFAHYARNCGSIACFMINLCNISEPDDTWILEFFLPAQEMDNNYPQTLLNSIWATIKECLPNYEIDSGELGHGFSVDVINAFKVGQPHSSLPHQEGSEHTNFMNMVEIGTGQSSIFYQKAATGKTPKTTPNEASRPRRSEKYFESTGNTVTDGRVDNPVAISTDEDVECAVTTESKRFKKSIIPFTKENVSKHFERPLKDAAESFGVSPSTFKRRCRSLGITWWKPSKRKLIATEKGKQNVSSSMRPLQDTPVHRSQALEKMTVKANYNGVTIKFGLTNSSGISELEDSVIKRLHLEKNSFSIMYEDNDDELILIGCDEDVQECMEFSRMAEKATIKMLIHPPVNHYAP